MESDETSRIRSTLCDSGCNAVMTAKYLRLCEEGKKDEQLRLLAIHRVGLLNKIHGYQKKLDCLDFLIFSTKRTGGRHSYKGTEEQ